MRDKWLNTGFENCPLVPHGDIRRDELDEERVKEMQIVSVFRFLILRSSFR